MYLRPLGFSELLAVGSETGTQVAVWRWTHVPRVTRPLSATAWKAPASALAYSAHFESGSRIPAKRPATTDSSSGRGRVTWPNDVALIRAGHQRISAVTRSNSSCEL